MKIPASTQTHTILRLKEKGIKHFNEPGRGDQYIKVVIKTPTKINKKMRKLLKEFHEEEKTHGGLKKKILKTLKDTF